MSCGVGQLNGTKSALFDGAGNPNAALSSFVRLAADGSGPVFDAVSWTDVSWSDVSWEDGADGEFLDGDGHELTTAEAAAAAADPDLLTPTELEAYLSSLSTLLP